MSAIADAIPNPIANAIAETRDDGFPATRNEGDRDREMVRHDFQEKKEKKKDIKVRRQDKGKG